MKIAVIGAGITGLSSAYELGKKGHEVVVFERSQYPGGLGSCIKVKNNYLERYYHHIFISHSHIKEIAEELGIENKLKFYKAKTGIYSGNKIYPFSSPLNLFKFVPLSFIDRLRCGIMLVFFKLLPFPLQSFDRIPAQKWIKKYAGEKVYEKIWGPLLEGKFSKFANKISALWLWGRIRGRSFQLGYFDGSVKILFDKFIKEIEKRKGIVKLGAEIIEIKENKNGVLIKEKNAEYKFDKAIITTVSPIANLLIKEGFSEGFRSHLNSVDHLGAICLILELKHPIQSQYWLNICDKKLPVLIMIEHTNMIDKKHYGGRSIVYLANYLHRNDIRFKISDEEVLKQYTSILKKMNKNYTNSWILKSYVSRIPRAQTIFKTGSLKKLPPIQLPSSNLYMVNIDQMYPYDRDLNQGVKLGKKVTELI